jgi:murein DD-endopeptidase MepM/ murein hydrolase activator NlpD
MVDKRFPTLCSILFGFSAVLMILLTILLFYEYRFFCNQAQELIVLKQQYAQYVDVLQRKIDETAGNTSAVTSYEISEDLVEESPITMDELSVAEASDEPDDDDEYADESFVVINRHPDYLKQSTLDYMESQDLNALMTAIDMNRWSDYTEQPVVVQQPKKETVMRPVVRPVDSRKKETKISAIRRPIKECGFVWPIDADKFWLSSLFGPRKRINGTWGFHHGIDMAAVKGTAVKAARAGTVVEACFQTGYGNTVVIKHSEVIKTRYAHLHAIRVYAGQKIKQGTIVGTVGETGFIRKKGKDGSHLHFEVYENGKRINPLHCLPRTA